MPLNEDIFPFELPLHILLRRNISRWFDPVAEIESGGLVSAQDLFNFGGLPNVERSFAMLWLVCFDQAIRVQGRVKRAFRSTHLSADKLQHVLGCISKELVMGNLISLEVGDGELGLVVKHLLKVRHVPGGISGITMEAAANVIMHASGGHPPQSVKCHLQGVSLPGAHVIPEEKIERHGPREFWGSAKTAVSWIVTGLDLLISLVQHLRL